MADVLSPQPREEVRVAIVTTANIARVLRTRRRGVLSRMAPTVYEYATVKELDGLLDAALTALEHVRSETTP